MASPAATWTKRLSCPAIVQEAREHSLAMPGLASTKPTPCSGGRVDGAVVLGGIRLTEDIRIGKIIVLSWQVVIHAVYRSLDVFARCSPAYQSQRDSGNTGHIAALFKKSLD